MATIAAGGLATGVSIGITTIGATAGSLVALPAVLTVRGPGRCGDIASRKTFTARIAYSWGHNGTNALNHKIEAYHTANLTSTLTSVATGDDDKLEWHGVPGGNASIIDDDINMNSSPATKRTVRGGGQVEATVDGNPIPGTWLFVDLTTCSYRFLTTPWISMVETQSDGRTERASLPLGTLAIGWRPLGTWQDGIGDLAQYIWPAHSLQWLGGQRAPADAYFPQGYGPLFFAGGLAGPMERPLPGPFGNWLFN